MEKINNYNTYKEIKKWVKDNTPKLIELGAKSTLDRFNKYYKDFEKDLGDNAKDRTLIMTHNDSVWDNGKLGGVKAQYEYLKEVWDAGRKKAETDYLSSQQRWGKLIEFFSEMKDEEKLGEGDEKFTEGARELFALVDKKEIQDRVLEKVKYGKSWQGGNYITLKYVREHAVGTEAGFYDGCWETILCLNNNHSNIGKQGILDILEERVISMIIRPLHYKTDDYGQKEFIERVADYEKIELEL